MSQRFRTRGYVPGGFIVNAKQQVVEMAALPPFLRTLLVTDGTVTKSLEAYFWEVVNVENLGQSVVTLEQDVEWLQARRDDAVLKRRVRLVGADSGTVYAYAESLLRHRLLSPDLQQSLLEGKLGIGELLRECGLETYRELLDFGTEPVADMATVFNNQGGDELVYRVYRIALHGEPVILITEKFPRRVFESNRHP
jgi:chorismate-pyruvate lyase